MAGAAVSWQSKKQNLVALSSSEAEFYAASYAGCYVLYLHCMVQELGYEQRGPTPVFEDNWECIYLSSYSMMFHHTKHIDTLVFRLREICNEGHMILQKASASGKITRSLRRKAGPAAVGSTAEECRQRVKALEREEREEREERAETQRMLGVLAKRHIPQRAHCHSLRPETWLEAVAEYEATEGRGHLAQRFKQTLCAEVEVATAGDSEVERLGSLRAGLGRGAGGGGGEEEAEGEAWGGAGEHTAGGGAEAGDAGAGAGGAGGAAEGAAVGVACAADAPRRHTVRARHPAPDVLCNPPAAYK
eukprot:1980348-Rhodomonas_salina.1